MWYDDLGLYSSDFTSEYWSRHWEPPSEYWSRPLDQHWEPPPSRDIPDQHWEPPSSRDASPPPVHDVPPPPPRDERNQFDKDLEEYRKILEGILQSIVVPEFEKTFAGAFGALPGLTLPSLEEAAGKIMGLADYRGLHDEAMGTLDQNLAAAQAIAASRGIASGGFHAAKGRDITSRVLQGLARDINTDKLQRAGLLGNIYQNMLGLQARDLESRRGGAMDVYRTKYGGALAQQGMALDVWRSLLQGKAAQAAQQGQNQTGFLGGLLGFLGTLIPLLLHSDRRIKDVQGSGSQTADKFMDSLAPYLYKYKGSNKPHLGVMAQDVERGDPSLVRDTPMGKAIDIPEATGAVLASLARLNERVKNLEKG